MTTCPSLASDAPPRSLIQEMKGPEEGRHPIQEMEAVKGMAETSAPQQSIEMDGDILRHYTMRGFAKTSVATALFRRWHGGL